MRKRPLLASLLLIAAAVPAPAQGVTLEQLAQLAKARAEKLRPQLEQKLQPYLELLAQPYKRQWVEIDKKIPEIAALGDSLVPLLLEKLEPKRGNPATLNLAANAARVLAQMDPASFVDALIVIAEGDSYHGVGHAIPLLGKTGSPRAGEVLTRLLDRDKDHRRDIVQALTELGHKGAALKVAKTLPLLDREDDTVAARYLREVAVPAVVPEVLRALGEVKLGSQIMRYVEVLAACAKGDGQTAEKLLPLFDNQKLDRTEWADLAAALAVIAPEGHQPTIDRLQQMLEDDDTGSLELRAALTLDALGDRTGPQTLKRSLLRKTRSSRHKRNYLNHANLGDFYLAFGDARSAASAYKSAIDTATGNAIQAMLYIQLARAQARREKWRLVRDALRDSKMPYSRLMKAAADYPELAEAMRQPPVTKFIEAFGR